jgi:hypothetical protein
MGISVEQDGLTVRVDSILVRCCKCAALIARILVPITIHQRHGWCGSVHFTTKRNLSAACTLLTEERTKCSVDEPEACKHCLENDPSLMGTEEDEEYFDCVLDTAASWVVEDAGALAASPWRELPLSTKIRKWLLGPRRDLTPC